MSRTIKFTKAGGPRITNSKGVRVVFDAIGGPNFPTLISALAFQGTVYIYGALAEGDTPMPVLAMIAKVPVIKGHNIWLTTGDETRRTAAAEFVLKGLESGALKPVIDRVFKFDDMVEFTAIWRTTASSERSSLRCEVHPTNAQYISSEE
jgi:NADPH:quinone reductase-like Zn-dependent oxidoreductase